jgi:Omp85 superfamily domain
VACLMRGRPALWNSTPARRRATLIVALVLAVFAARFVAEAQEAGPPKHDPLQGMERSGRIPKVPLPEDLPNPERWRYLPEGRIKPGNIFERFLVSSFIAPQFFFEQDIGAGAGIAFTDIDFRSERRREFLGAFLSYTTEGQQKYRLIWRRWLHHRDLTEGGVIVEERSHLDAFGGYEKSLTRRFFGFGPDTRARDETSYLDEVSELGVRGEFALPQAGGNWIATIGARGEYHNLGPGRVSGRPTTDEVFPGLFAAGDDHGSFIVSTGLRYDTRDSQHQPYSGYQVGVFVDAALWQSTGDAGAVATAFANVAFRLPPLLHRGGDEREENPPTDTLALGLAVKASAGALPFYERPSLGGADTLRGYIANRFTDDSSWHGVAEYRFWIIPRGFAFTDTIRIERIGMALFYEAGTVADGLDRLPAARVHMSYGVGLRFSLERTAVFRADVGFSSEGVNVTVGFGLSF